MPRKSTPYITQYFNRDRIAFTALSKVGHVSVFQLQMCGLANSRIRNYVKDGLVEKVIYKNGNKIEEVYKLTKSGRELAIENWGLKAHYHPQSPYHDIEVANKYFSLKEELRETVKTETELRDLFQEYINQIRDQGDFETSKLYADMLDEGLISMPDFSYINEQGVEVSFEVITNNYGETELQAKEAYVQIMNTKYETTRV